MIRMEGMDSGHASTTKPVDRDTIEAAIHAVFAAEFTGGKHPSTLESYQLLKEKVAFRHPQ